ncbi:restriction endonuclease subunit S [Acinetobacter nosocomialis]|nr:restriction endonuclease subunit S [Acinetobacter nosocomialis]MDO7215739.1 restriction endonuclease subunit S [Acinetobacter nosocomialis]
MSQLPRYESYKDSGVQWLGEIPSHWYVTRLKFILAVKKNAIKVGPFGSDLKGDDFQTSGYPVYNQRTVLDNNFIDGTAFISEEKFKDLSGFKIEPLDILVTTRGTIGKIAVAPKDVNDGIIHPCIMKFSINRGAVTEKLLKYLFNEIDYVFNQFVLASGTTTIPVIYSDTLKNIVLPLPPITEQKIIAEFLDKRLAQVDALIAKQEILLEKLAEQRVALISHAVTKGLNPDVEMKESGVEWLGKVPKSWDIANLRYFISCNSGDALESSRILRDADEFNNIPVIGGNGLLGFTENSNYKKECIAVGRVGALCGNVHFIDYESWINDNALLIKLISDKFNINYLVYLLRSRNLNELASKTAQPLLTGTQVKAEKVCIPLMSEQLEIVRYLDTNLETLDKLHETVNKTIQTLREYRSTLITQVVTGKIDVRNLKLN